VGVANTVDAASRKIYTWNEYMQP